MGADYLENCYIRQLFITPFGSIMPTILAILSSLFFLMPSILLSGQNCVALIKLRDVQLITEYDRAVSKYTLNNDQKNQIEKYKKELLDDTKWATAEPVLGTSMFLQVVRLICNLINNVLEMSPATGVAGKVINKTSRTAEGFFLAIQNGSNLNEIIESGSQQVVIKEFLASRGDLGKAVKTVWDLQDDFQELMQTPQQRNTLKLEVIRILKLLDQQLLKYERGFKESQDRLNYINQIRLGIDKYLLKNCSPKDEIDAQLQKALSIRTDTAKWSLIPNLSGNGFYMTICKEIEVAGEGEIFQSGIRGPKRYYFYSEPIIYTQDFEDLKDKLSLELEMRIEKKFPEIKKSSYFTTIYITTSNPGDWSATNKFRTKEECLAETVKSKKKASDGWNGNTKRFVIIQF